MTPSMSGRRTPTIRLTFHTAPPANHGPCLSGKRRRAASLTPCALRGGSGPGSSYRHMFLSFTGYALSKPFSPHARTHSGESFKRSGHFLDCEQALLAQSIIA